jgi:hypothetical protein
LTFVEIAADYLKRTPTHDELQEMHKEIEEQLFELQMRHEGECEFCDEFWGDRSNGVWIGQTKADA